MFIAPEQCILYECIPKTWVMPAQNVSRFNKNYCINRTLRPLSVLKFQSDLCILITKINVTIYHLYYITIYIICMYNVCMYEPCLIKTHREVCSPPDLSLSLRLHKVIKLFIFIITILFLFQAAWWGIESDLASRHSQGDSGYSTPLSSCTSSFFPQV